MPALYPPSRRLGPRPLPLLLANEGMGLMRALAVAARLRKDPRAVDLLPPAIQAALGQIPLAGFADALDAEARRRYGAFLAGVTRYRKAPESSPSTRGRVVWQCGGCRLLAYGDGAGRPVLVVPSLVNRATILDLPGRSVMAHLAAQGLQPFLLEWGWPTPEELAFTLSDVITQRLEPAIRAVVERTQTPVALVGYCMGGLLSMAAASRQPDAVSALVALAVPWDFHVETIIAADILTSTLPALSAWLTSLQAVPVDIIQAFFVGLDPAGVSRKYRWFSSMAENTPAFEEFLRLEDWLNDGVPLAGAVAVECLRDWYGSNLPARLEWQVDGQLIKPGEYLGASLVIIPSRDRIVPPASAQALAEALPSPTVWTVGLGHVGMIAGKSAEAQVHQPLAEWLLTY